MQVSTGGGGNAALIQQMRQQIVSRADKDRDGSVSLAGFQAMAKPAASVAREARDAAFRALDADADGRLGAAEMAKAGPCHLRDGSRPAVGLSALLGAQEVGQAATGGVLGAVSARMLRAYGGGVAA